MKQEDRTVFDLVGKSGENSTPYGEDPDQLIEHFPASNKKNGELAFIHGGYWRPEYDREHLRPLAQSLAENGYSTHLIEYRRTPGDPDKGITDIKTALYLLGEVVVIGHSAGGHLALINHDHKNVKAVIALAPITDLVVGELENYDAGAIGQYLGCSAIERLDLNPISKNYTKPICIIHGVDDIRVPVEQSRNFATTHLNIKYIEVKNIGHFELIDPRAKVFDLLLNEIRKLL